LEELKVLIQLVDGRWFLAACGICLKAWIPEFESSSELTFIDEESVWEDEL
jgi:hypothetical protein